MGKFVVDTEKHVDLRGLPPHNLDRDVELAVSVSDRLSPADYASAKTNAGTLTLLDAWYATQTGHIANGVARSAWWAGLPIDTREGLRLAILT
jgi:hypothetical protein